MSAYGGNEYMNLINQGPGSGSAPSGGYSQGGPSNPNDFMNFFVNPDSMDPVDRAKSMGFVPMKGEPDSFVSIGPGIGKILSRSHFEDQPQGANIMGQAAFQDFMNFLDATNQNYQEGRGAIDDVRQSVVGGAEDIRTGGQDAFDYMNTLAEGSRAEGQQMYDDTVTRTGEMVDEYAKERMERLPAELSTGLARRQTNSQTRQQIEAEAKAGKPEASQALMKFEQAENEHYMQESARLGTQAADAIMSAKFQREGVIQSAAGLKSSYEARADEMGKTGMAMQQSAISTAANFEAQGMSGVANIVLSNPYSPVALLPTIMAMFQYTQTPGSGEFDIDESFFSDYIPGSSGSMIA
tara:strand:+ start:18577 stop:19635 length:1059 start_codon:yes stop_codon:yes gene_type:complete